MFYAIAIIGIGLQAFYYSDFAYMLIPPKHSAIPSLAILAYLFGTFLIVSGICIAFEKKAKPVSLLLGFILLLIFCFYFVPYLLFYDPNNTIFGEWENAEKELALSAGAFVIASGFSPDTENGFTNFLAKLIPLGTLFFSLCMICFGISHFLYPQDVADYMPKWIPYKLFWGYLAGSGLIGSGIAIILNVKPRLAATLLGAMIFTWFIILHIPYTLVNPFGGKGGETTSAFLALAYSGIAFVIAGTGKKPLSTK
jgi:uncharacterized membrane protein YphA (DoxX/SURF4 family)